MEQRILSKIFAIMQRKEDKLINKRKIISFVTYLIKEGIIIKAAIFGSLSKRDIPQWRHLMLLSGRPMSRWGGCGEGWRAFHLATTAMTWMTELAQPTAVWESTWKTTPSTLMSATSTSVTRVVVARFQTSGGLFGNGWVVIVGTLVALHKVKIYTPTTAHPTYRMLVLLAPNDCMLYLQPTYIFTEFLQKRCKISIFSPST